MPTFRGQGPIIEINLVMVWEAFHPTVLGILLLRSGKDFIDRPFSVLLLLA